MRRQADFRFGICFGIYRPAFASIFSPSHSLIYWLTKPKHFHRPKETMTSCCQHFLFGIIVVEQLCEHLVWGWIRRDREAVSCVFTKQFPLDICGYKQQHPRFPWHPDRWSTNTLPLLLCLNLEVFKHSDSSWCSKASHKTRGGQISNHSKALIC